MLLHGAFADDDPLRDALVRVPLGQQAEHLALARGELGELGLLAWAAEHPADDFGVEHGAAAGHTPERAGELVEVGDPVLEQVPDAACVVADQLERVGRLDVLAEQEHADVGVRLPDRHGRAQAVVGVRGRHADVDHGRVGAMRADLADEVVGVARLCDDVEAVRLEHVDQPLEQQGVIVGDDHPEPGLVRFGLHRPGLPSPSRASPREARRETRDLGRCCTQEATPCGRRELAPRTRGAGSPRRRLSAPTPRPGSALGGCGQSLPTPL